MTRRHHRGSRRDRPGRQAARSLHPAAAHGGRAATRSPTRACRSRTSTASRPSARPDPVQVAHALGITPRWMDGTGVGGTSFLLHVRHAAAAIQAGYATHRADHARRVRPVEGRRRAVTVRPRRRCPASSRRRTASSAPPTAFTIPALRYMKEYGLTHEQLAYVAVAQRRWAAKNPRAMYRDPITVDDVLASRIVAYPFHLLECCLVTDGGGALVVTSARPRGATSPSRRCTCSAPASRPRRR